MERDRSAGIKPLLKPTFNEDPITRIRSDIDNLFTRVKRLQDDMYNAIRSQSRVEKDYLAGLKGKAITLALLNGQEITCCLLAYDKYGLFVKIPDRPSFLIYKSAIVSIISE